MKCLFREKERGERELDLLRDNSLFNNDKYKLIRSKRILILIIIFLREFIYIFQFMQTARRLLVFTFFFFIEYLSLIGTMTVSFPSTL